ncbi:MAG: VIT domain-containing protein, partial [Roseimicrobium sp.]
MKAIFPTALVALLLLSTASGQLNRSGLVVPRPPQPPPMEVSRPPTIWINPEFGKFKPMKVQSVDVDIKVRGHLATTTIEMAFFNPNARVLEGELIFPLGEGQTIAGYALEVEGKLRQAVVVEKEKGREIFEEIVRRGIDPGLAELTKGNVFRTRVYPIPANGTKRLAITFEQELVDDGKGYRYLLPLAFTEKVGKFHARAEVVKQENAPMPDADNGETLTFEKWRDSFVAELTKENATHEKPLAFTVPKLVDRPQIFLVSEKLDPARMYFHAKVDPE